MADSKMSQPTETGPPTARLPEQPDLDFPAVSREEWRRKVEKELRGASFDSLVSTTRSGLAIGPLFDAGDRPASFDRTPLLAAAARRPGERAWITAHEITPTSVAATRRAVSAARGAGAELLWLRFDRNPGAISGDFLEGLRSGIDIGEIAVVLEGGAETPALAARWLEAAGGNPLAGFGCDPLAELARRGRLGGSLDRAFEQLAELALSEANRPVLVSTEPYQEAGATAVQELAFSLSTGVEYLRGLTAAGLDVGTAAARFRFASSVGSDLFLEISKLRAARILWSRVLAASGACEKMWLHTRGSRQAASRRGPWMNLLRASAQTFAAALGGADSIATAPFDEALGEPSSASRRLALGVQHLLAEEAHLGRVADPAGGGGYLDSLTDRLARAGWKLFQDLEKDGGMARCLTTDRVADLVRSSAQELRRDVATRRAPIIGASAFTRLDEEPLERAPATAAEHTAESGDHWVGSEPATAPALERFRLAEPFEAMRDAVDRWRAGEDRWLRAWIVKLGRTAESAERSAFTRRLLAAGGIEGVDIGPFDGEPAEVAADLAPALDNIDAKVFVLCGAERRYPDLVPELVPVLRRCGARRIFVAGEGGEQHDALRAAGADGFIDDGSDVVTLLTRLLEELGVTRREVTT